jgi:hypothetical protein
MCLFGGVGDSGVRVASSSFDDDGADHFACALCVVFESEQGRSDPHQK